MNGIAVRTTLIALLVSPSVATADFTVNNILIEVGVSAGDASDGFGGDEFVEVSLSVSDGDINTNDYQIAEALFNLGLNKDSANGDYELSYGSDVFAMTNGEGTASALANSIIVFEISDDFFASSIAGDSVLFDALGMPITLLDDQSQRLDAGRYSLSFGASASIQSNDTTFFEESSVSGVITFTVIPEPAAGSIILFVSMLAAARRRRNAGKI